MGKIVGPFQVDSKTGKANYRSETVPKTLQEIAMSESGNCQWVHKGVTDKHFCAKVESEDDIVVLAMKILDLHCCVNLKEENNVLMGLLTLADSCMSLINMANLLSSRKSTHT